LIFCDTDKTADNLEYISTLRSEFARQRVPAYGSLELTHRCNLRCIHCYLGGSDDNKEELTTDEWRLVIDQIAESGCLTLIITGGEPLLRPDFADIYRHAKKKGLLVTVFTNGTLIQESILELFEDLPPYSIEITLYGATPVTYEKITGVPGSFEKCIKSILEIKKRNFNLKLKAILLRTNQHELKTIHAISQKFNAEFRLDPAIFPALNNSKAPVALRVPPHEAVSIEFDDPKRLEEWQKFYNRLRKVPGDEFLFTCGAGLTSFHIDPEGNLSPCLMVREPKYNILKGDFTKGWNETISCIREIKVGRNYHCNHCEKRFLCGLCPGFSRLEQGSFEGISPYLCSLGEERYKTLNAIQS